jgi:hypothetical protein
LLPGQTSQELKVVKLRRKLGEVLPVRPGGCLVVEGAGLRASVQDADEPVGELAEGCVVLGDPGTLGDSVLPVTGRDTIYPQGSKPRGTKCSPASGHEAPSLPHDGPGNTH